MMHVSNMYLHPAVWTDLKIAKPPARLEVRDMIKNQPNQWNLYLLGLERFQKSVAENNPLSYFQIAGMAQVYHQPSLVTDT